MYIFRLFILMLLSAHCFAFNDGPIPQEVMKKAERKYGGEIVLRYLEYNKLLGKLEHVPERNKLQEVNAFINKIPFLDDQQNWKQEDYWATPLELLARNKGDSEDYVIAKYFALKTLGVDTKKLYFTYVNAKELNQAHMVLSYFEHPKADPFILDNLKDDILPASERTDLTPVYNFNPNLTLNSTEQKLQESSHKKWKKLSKRVKRNKL